MARGMKSEAGYTIVEVLASIVILSIAIIPMVAMFDTGLRAASSSGNYDTARSFATKKLEQAKSIPYADARDKFPRASDSTPTTGSPASIDHANEPSQVPAGFRTTPVPEGFRYEVRKQFLTLTGVGGSRTLTPGGSDDKGMIEVTVTVRWGDGNSYSTSGVVSKGAL